MEISLVRNNHHVIRTYEGAAIEHKSIYDYLGRVEMQQ